jgi:hypothetical protein
MIVPRPGGRRPPLVARRAHVIACGFVAGDDLEERARDRVPAGEVVLERQPVHEFAGVVGGEPHRVNPGQLLAHHGLEDGPRETDQQMLGEQMGQEGPGVPGWLDGDPGSRRASRTDIRGSSASEAGLY